MFPYENWDIYKKLVELEEIVAELSRHKPKGMAKEYDNLVRAVSSAKNNLAEGIGFIVPGKKINSYENGLGSIHEAATGLLTIGRRTRNSYLIVRGRRLCDDIGAMFTNLIKSVQRRAASEGVKGQKGRNLQIRRDAVPEPDPEPDPDPDAFPDPDAPPGDDDSANESG